MKTHRSSANASIVILVPVVALFACAIGANGLAGQSDSTVAVTIVADESEAVLAILAKRRSGGMVTEGDWERLFASEGYVRLKKREASLNREFTDEEFRSFVLSDSLLRRFEELQSTLERWRKIDMKGASRRALEYLPQRAAIRAKIYPVIKPRTNSFVFETATNPAIFLYLDPAVSGEEFENMLAHELHHIGYSASCGGMARQLTQDTTRSEQVRTVLGWISAFGEGFAMLAAAGGPNVHPHAVSPPEERDRWDADVGNFNKDLKTVEQFFFDILGNALTREKIRETAASFFGIQGPWYTVGWKMAVTIERVFGRGKLIECLCDPRLLLATYNSAAVQQNRAGAESLAVWSSRLIQTLAE